MTKIVFEDFLDRYIIPIDRKYWDYADLLDILQSSRAEERVLMEMVAFHFASDDAVTPVRSANLARPINSDEALGEN
ncbi:MAG: hypothetical protein AABW87_01685, partial [Nanoarchaeota archaeon]